MFKWILLYYLRVFKRKYENINCADTKLGRERMPDYCSQTSNYLINNTSNGICLFFF